MTQDTIDKLSNLVYRMECGTSVLLCIADALAWNAYAAETYSPAVQSVLDSYQGIVSDLRQMITEEKGTGA